MQGQVQGFMGSSKEFFECCNNNNAVLAKFYYEALDYLLNFGFET